MVGVGLGGLGVALYAQGLDGADKVASVVSMFAGLAGLAVAVVAGRRAARGDVTRSELEFRDVTGTVTGVEADRVRGGTLIGRLKARDVREGGSVTGMRIGDLGGTDGDDGGAQVSGGAGDRDR